MTTNKTMVFLINGILCVGFLLGMLLCREANIDERYEAQAKVAQEVKAESKAMQAAKVKALRAGLANIQKLHTCSKDANTFGLETDFVVVSGVDQYGPKYFSDTLYAVPLAEALSMKPGTVWNLLYCIN